MARYIKPYTGGYDRDNADIGTVFDTENIPLPTSDNSNNDLGQYADMWVDPTSSSLPTPSSDDSWWSKLKNDYWNAEDKFNNFMDSNPIGKFVSRLGESGARAITGDTTSNTDTGSWLGNTAADVVGTGLGFMAKLPGINESTGSIMNKTVGQPVENTLKDFASKYGLNNKATDYAIQGLKTGSEFGAYEGLNNAVQGKDIGEGVANGMGSGLLFGVGGKAVGEAFSHFIPGIGKTKVVGNDGSRLKIQDENGNVTDMNKTIFDNTAQQMPQTKPIQPFENTLDINRPLENRTSEIPYISDNSIPMNLQRHGVDMDLNALSRRGQENDLNLFQDRTGREPNAGDYKERQVIANSFMNSEAIPKEVKDSLAADPTKYQYLEHNNEQTMMKARESVEKNFDGAVGKIRNLKALEDDADTATAIEIERKYIENGEYDKARDWSLKVAKLGTKSGQAIQYFSTIKRMTPEWTLNRASKMIDGTVTDKQREILNNAPTDKVAEIAKKNKIPYLSDEATKQIIDMSKQIQDMPEGRAKREAIANLNDTVQREIPTSILDKINSVQTLSMLSGTKTPIRNIIGNTLFKAVDNIKEIPRTLIDMPLSLATGKRTATLPMLGSQLKGYGAGVKESFLDLKNNVNTKNIDDKFELNRRNTWDKNGNLFNKAMSQAERVNRFALDDRPAMSASYEGEMARQRKLAKMNGTEFDEMAAKEKAELKSLHDTFSDDTAISQLVTNLKRNANIVGNSIVTGNIGKKLDQATKDEFSKWGVGDLLVKFARVPANIVARQVEYSPISLITPFVKATRDAIKKEKFDQDAFADGLAKGLTGSGIMGVGAMLHNVMTTDSDKNKNKSELDKEAGLGSFKMNVSALQRLIGGGDTKTQKGDNIVSYDWANPISVLLAAGASMAKATDGKTVKGIGKIAGTLVDALNEGVNSVIEQPMNQGLKTWIQQGDIMGGLSQVIASLPQTFIPSLVNQFRQLNDNTTRETYDPNLFKQGINQMVNRIPGLEKQLPQKVDIWGKGKETSQNSTNNPLGVFLNPAISTQYLPTPQIEKALSLYGHTANSEALPKFADKTLNVDNKKVKLTPDEFIQLQSAMGKGATDIYNGILSDDNSNKLAKDTAKALSGNSQDAKIKVLQDNNLPLPLSVTKDALSQDLYKKRSTESKTVRDKIKDITNSDMTIDEQKKALQDLRDQAQGAAKKNPPKKKGNKTTIFDH